MENTTQPTTKVKDPENTLRECILMAAEMETAFKLYSYRVISPDAFVSRCADVVLNFQRCLETEIVDE